MRIQDNGSHVAGIELMSGHGNWGIYNSDTVGDALEFRDDSASATRMIITNAGSVGINESSPDFSGFGSNGGGLELDDVGSSFTAVKVSQGATGNLYLAASTGAGYLWQHSNSPLIMGTNNTEITRIHENGRQTFNGSGTANAHATFVGEVGHSYKALAFERTVGGGEVGTIVANASSTTYNTSSDYRLKENVDYTWDATTRLKQLKPARFNWIADSSNTLQDGFLAHEVSSIVPEAVTGVKDEVYTKDDETNGDGTQGDPIYQGIDHSKLVPLLVKTVQELEARIKTLEG